MNFEFLRIFTSWKEKSGKWFIQQGRKETSLGKSRNFTSLPEAIAEAKSTDANVIGDARHLPYRRGPDVKLPTEIKDK